MILLFQPPVRRASGIFTTYSVRPFATALPQAVQERRPAEKLPSTPARTRFAPSPTGYLHLGSLRTAVFNYLLARATGGQFCLRIEDTDQKRTLPDALKRLCADLRWAGLQWDEGPEVGGPYGPYIQSERVDLYREHAEILLDKGHAYRCFCTAERLRKLAEQKHATAVFGSYDRNCFRLDEGLVQEKLDRGERFVVRLRMPSTIPEVRDLIYGSVRGDASHDRRRKIGEEVSAFEDPVLLKTDGFPTYHLANVVDDHHMRITHVIRAAEWLPSTPKHMALYQAFGWDAPAFAHVGLILDSSKQKMSKRVGGHDIQSLREQGILPEALVNHLALLGWSHRLTDDFLQMQDLVQYFDLKFTKGNVVQNPGKLFNLQARHSAVRLQEQGDFFKQAASDVKRLILESGDPAELLFSEAQITKIIERVLIDHPGNFETAEQFAARQLDLFYPREREPLKPGFRDPAILKLLPTFTSRLYSLKDTDWQADNIRSTMEDCQGELSLLDSSEAEKRRLGKALMGYLRWALYGGRVGPPVHDIMLYLGREETCKRLETAKEDPDSDKASELGDRNQAGT